MFGKILKIDNNEITVENLMGKTASNLMNCHITILEEVRKIIGEVIYIDNSIAKILLMGEIVNDVFVPGTIRKPSGNAPMRVINLQELELIYGKNELTKENLYLGNSAIYKDFKISISLNNFFSSHSAIIGNTGSGKSCGVARMLQNLFLLNPNKPQNAHIVLFDAYGEYINTFDEMNNVGLKFAKYSSNNLNGGELPLRFPAYFLDVDDLALLLGVTSADAIPVLNKTLKLVAIFKSDEPKMKEYKNDIIAECLLDILTSGRNPSTIRDQIIAVLSRYNTDILNLDSIIHQPGYDRTLQQCLLIDDQGKMSSISEVMRFLNEFEKVNLDNIFLINDLAYNLDDLYYALEFALISEGTINNDNAYKKINILKTRLQTIINGNYKDIFSYDDYQSKEDFVKDMFLNNQLVNINLSYFDDKFAKTITKLYSKLLFNYTTHLTNRGEVSFNIILEEAHRYVQNDSDVEIIGYNIFDRITKEGRKYGTLLTFITQRPSELSTTALSQCANFIVFRMYHPKDLEIVRSMSTNVSATTIEQVKSLNPGTAFAFGTGFKIPTLIVFDLPKPMPESTSINIANIWFNGGIQ